MSKLLVIWFLKSIEIFVYVHLVLMLLILLKVDIYATKICVKVGLFSIKSSIYLIFKKKYFVGRCLIAYFLIYYKVNFVF